MPYHRYVRVVIHSRAACIGYLVKISPRVNMLFRRVNYGLWNHRDRDLYALLELISGLLALGAAVEMADAEELWALARAHEGERDWLTN